MCTLIGCTLGDVQNLHWDCSVKDDILGNCVTKYETQCYSVLRGQLEKLQSQSSSATIQLLKISMNISVQ